MKLGGILVSWKVYAQKQCGVGLCVLAEKSSILVCPVVPVSVSSQLPVLLQCLLPTHVQSGECSTSKHPNLHEAQASNLLLDTHHDPFRPLHLICVYVCVCLSPTCRAWGRRACRTLQEEYIE